MFLKDDLLSIPEADGKILVLHEVLDMAHLVMDRVPLFEAVVVGAHLDPVVLVIEFDVERNIQYSAG